jgi:peptidoglycan hydrolase-like protein with peptidoglycan-binding domain
LSIASATSVDARRQPLRLASEPFGSEPLHVRRRWEPAPALGWRLWTALPWRWRRKVLLALALVVAAALLAGTALPMVTSVAWRQGGWPLQAQGMDGPSVRSVQYLLQARGHDLAVDGDFGPQTHANVVAFQRARGLKVDGIVGPETWSMLTVPMERGLEGNSVRAVQAQLTARGIPTAVDGIFGPVTQGNVAAFQRARDLPDTGSVDLDTWNGLFTPRGAWEGPPSAQEQQQSAPPEEQPGGPAEPEPEPEPEPPPSTLPVTP